MEPMVTNQPNQSKLEPIGGTDNPLHVPMQPIPSPHSVVPNQPMQPIPSPYSVVPNQPMQPIPSPYSVVTNQPTTTTTIIQLAQGNFRYPRGAPRDWSTPLCGCCESCCGCLCACFCFPCYECYVASKMGESCCTPCCLANATVVMRAYVRGRHNIQGSLAGDGCTTCCCPMCVLCQISREVDNIREGRAAP
ncbi:placenta-specific gene 8 protein-like [Patiria miniata]|uniref:Cornifelin n=1 Tax=Patiria miniata TaxID=46514 RepID=A0A913ZM57_PATMI|nr:placenta-specific gene 8 protein-like [Patiria miniata]